MTRVAAIGPGTMGLPMARHLVDAGHDVVGCDVDPERVVLLGARAARTSAAAAEGAEVVLLSLPTPDVVEAVVLGADGVRDGAGPGTLLVDMSTSPPALARRLASECAALDVLDAPVSGGPRGAEDATLTIMVGGDEAAFRRALPLFEILGRLVVLVGPHGAGQAAKLCNNLIAGARRRSHGRAGGPCRLSRRAARRPRRARLLGGLPPLRPGRGRRVGSRETPHDGEGGAARWQIPSSSPRRSSSKAA